MNTTVDQLRSQANEFLTYVSTDVVKQVLGADLPLIGDTLLNPLLAPGANTLLGELRTTINAALDKVDGAGAALAQDIATRLDALDYVAASADGTLVTIEITAGDSLSALQAQGLDIDIGWDALGLELKGGAKADLAFTVGAKLTFDVTTGELRLYDTDDKLVTVTLNGALDGSGEGSLGFIDITATDQFGGDELSVTGTVDYHAPVDGVLVTKLSDLSADDFQLTLKGAAQANLGISVDLSTDLLPKITTDLLAHYSFDYDSSNDDGFVTTTSLDLANIELDVGSIVGLLGDVFGPIVDNIFGAFPIKQLLGTLTAPLPLISDGSKEIGIFDELNIIKDKNINLLDLAGAYLLANGASIEVIETFSKAYSLIRAIDGLQAAATMSSVIGLGDYHIFGPVLPAMAALPEGSAKAIVALGGESPLAILGKALNDAGGPPTGGDGLGGPAGALSEILSGSGLLLPILEVKTIVALLTAGTSDKPVDLITYDIPPLAFDAAFHKFFPVIGPIGVAFDGGFGAKLDVDVGYDSRGLMKDGGSIVDGFYFTTKGNGSTTAPFFDPAGHVEAGVFASAAVNVGIGEAGVGGGVVAELNAYLDGADQPGGGKLYVSDLLQGEPCIFDPISGEFSVRVRAYVTVGVDPFSYTKRFDLVKKTLADFSFGCPPPETSEDMGLATIKGQAQVAYINAGNRAYLRAINGVVGTDTVNKDADEYFVVDQRENGSLLITAFGLTEINGHPGKKGTADDDIAPTQIIANMGNGNDQMVLEEKVTTPATLTGGVGDDLLGGGAGMDTLDGGPDSDRLLGRDGKDTLSGGTGNDYLEGGAGPDTLDGGADFDQVTYENSSVGVVFTPTGAGGRFVGSGGEAEGDTLISIEQITGSHFDDQLIGNPNEGNLLEGLDGVDILQGGAADDLLIGGGKGDTLNGGGGSDTTTYLTSAGQVVVNLAAGVGFGGDATGDSYSSIENVQGSGGNDGLYGDKANNTLMGWHGDDTLAGGAGFDTIYAGDGDDTVLALGDGDTLDGDGFTKLLRGDYFNPGKDLLSYEGAAKGVTAALAYYEIDGNSGKLTAVKPGEGYTNKFIRDRIEVNVVKVDNVLLGNSTFEDLTGSRYNDTLIGDWQNNVIRGLSGIDTIDGSNGNDTLIGGAGADALTGGDGRDLADYDESKLGVTVTLADGDGIGKGFGGDAEGDMLTGIENLRGSDRADVLTGNNVNNRIDPGISRIDGNADKVDGGAGGYDTLVLDWSRDDSGKGMYGGFALVAANAQTSSGAFAREEAKTTKLLDSVSFTNIESLFVIGTSKGDAIVGGAGSDTILGGDGADAIVTGIGFGPLDPTKPNGDRDYLAGGINYDFISGDAGNDVIGVNTGADGKLSFFGGTRFGLIDGGAGIDLLNASFTVATTDITLLGKAGTSEFHGKNYASPDGSAIVDFEILGAIATGLGDDILVQPGRYNNIFATGFGRDLIDAGQGKDVVDGGLDFAYGSEVTVTQAEPKKLIVNALDFASAFASDGDYLDVDYSAGTAGITSSVKVVDTGYTLARQGDSTGIRVATNNGFYQSGNDRVDFSNIERVAVLGTKFADQIFGTDLTYGINRRAGEANALLASDSQRGDDILFGNGGNDVIFGGTGDDVIRGGDGDDVLLGTAFPTSRSLGPVDLGEVDRIMGGAGRDVFLLGTTVVLYNDQASDAQTTHRRVSSENRAEVLDFDAKFDTIVLSALPVQGTNRRPFTAYDAVVHDGSTYIYLKDGVATADGSAASHNELIAVIEDVTNFSLAAKYVLYMQPDGSYVYGNGSPATPPPVLASGGANGLMQADVGRAASLVDHSTAFASADTIAAAPQPAAAPADTLGWVKQTGDANVLRSALFKGDTVFGAGTLKVEGNSAAVGIFQGDPFGLGSGVVLSTGRVLDLPGQNTIDGGRAAAGEATLKFDYAGTVQAADGQYSRIYRADLSGLGFDLNSIKLGDASGGFGGQGGVFSGFDIDAVVLSTEQRNFASDDAAVFNFGMSRLDAFDFDLGSVKYTPGSIRQPADGNTELRGQLNGLPLLSAVTLDRVDGDYDDSGHRALTLGEGGSIGFDLNQTVSTKGSLYLYVAEAGAAGEKLTSGLTASVSRLEAPADLSTDLGAPGLDGDTTTLTYTFVPRVTDGSAPNTVAFDVVFFSEEFAEFAQQGFNDKFKVMLNGVELARLSDGSYASIDTLYSPNAGPSARTSIYELRSDSPATRDLVYNPVGSGPAADRTHADGYSKVLHLAGTIDPTGTNVLTIQVSDEGDGYLDSGILIRGGSFAGSTEGRFTIERDDRSIHEGDRRSVAFGIDLPEGSRLSDPVTVVFSAPRDIDLGAGAGRDLTITFDPGQTGGLLTYTVLPDRVIGNSRFEAIGVTVRGLPGTDSVAPIVVNIDDSPSSRRYTIGDAPDTYDRTDPDAWQRAWSFDGLTITHTPGERTAYTAVNFGRARPDIISGSDMLAGDLGVSGMAGVRTANAQEIGGSERLKFDWASEDVNAVSLHFNLWDRGDVAIAEFYDAAGRLLDTRRTAETTLDVDGLDNVATMVVSAGAGSFVIDAIDVAETLPRRASSAPIFADHTDAYAELAAMSAGATRHGFWEPIYMP